jgi:hypothetical protein
MREKSKTGEKMNETVKALKRSFQTYLDNTDNDIISLLLTRDALEELVKALNDLESEDRE